MSSVQHIKGTTWRVKIPDGRDPGTGKRRTISRSFQASGVKDATKKARAIEYEIDRQRAEQAEHRGSVAALVDDWLEVKRRTNSPSTMIGYERHAERIKGRFGRMRAAELTGADIDRWYGELVADGEVTKSGKRTEVTPAGLVVLHRHLRAVLRFGYKRRGLPSVATDRADPGEHRPPEINPPKPAAVAALLGNLPVDSEPWARCVAMLALTGLRRGEVVGLRWADIGPDELVVRHSVVEPKGGGVVVRPYPKGKKPRTVPLEPPAAAILELQRSRLERASPWVFPDLVVDPSGRTPRRPGYISQAWLGNRDRLGATGWRLHDLRHAWATLLLDSDVPLNVVQKWLGHAQASTTLNVYGHRGDEGERRGREALKALSSGG